MGEWVNIAGDNRGLLCDSGYMCTDEVPLTVRVGVVSLTGSWVAVQELK